MPLAFFVWDDGYGISVPREYQTTKDSISEALSGMQLDEDGNGIRIYEVKAWDYPSLIQTFEDGISFCRENHIPVFFHVKEVTQPQGHSTSGSHGATRARSDWIGKQNTTASKKCGVDVCHGLASGRKRWTR